MTVSPFSLRIQHGIAGGFAPPRPSAIHDFSFEPSASHILLFSNVREDGTPNLLPKPPKKIAPSSEDTPALLSELKTILKDLPVEEVPSSDIYGKNIGIFFESDGFSWVNSAPQGCARFESDVKVSDEQKASFDRAVQIVETLAARGEVQED
ncbi:hypothetical protein OF83DRAFT_1071496 [Amylostereum chailletii]|nr:hypothetical protein OF83DRAFT_1071496 [Amylostereum chailletii]